MPLQSGKYGQMCVSSGRKPNVEKDTGVYHNKPPAWLNRRRSV